MSMAEVALYGDTVSISGTAVSLDWYNVALAGAPGTLAGDSGTLFQSPVPNSGNSVGLVMKVLLHFFVPTLTTWFVLWTLL